MKKLLISLALLPTLALADNYVVSADYGAAPVVQPTGFSVKCGTAAAITVPVTLDTSASNAIFFAYDLTTAGITTNAQLAACSVASVSTTLNLVSAYVPFPAAFPTAAAAPGGLQIINSVAAPTKP